MISFLGREVKTVETFSFLDLFEAVLDDVRKFDVKSVTLVEDSPKAITGYLLRVDQNERYFGFNLKIQAKPYIGLHSDVGMVPAYRYRVSPEVAQHPRMAELCKGPYPNLRELVRRGTGRAAIGRALATGCPDGIEAAAGLVMDQLGTGKEGADLPDGVIPRRRVNIFPGKP